MSVLARLNRVVKANLHAILDKFENPDKMIDQSLRELNIALAKLQQEAAFIIDERDHCKRNMDSLESEINDWDARARKALLKGKEDNARIFISKKQAVEIKYKEASILYDAAETNACKVRDMHDSLMLKIHEKEVERRALKITSSLADSQERINKLSSTLNIDGTFAQFDKYCDKISSRLNQEEIIKELMASPLDEAELLAREYDADVADKKVDTELSRLKKEMNL